MAGRSIVRGLRLLRIGYREPRLGLLMLDNLVTTLGASFTLLALPFLVMRLSGRALDLGVTAAIEAVPSLCLLLFFPHLLDRLQPLRVLLTCRLLFVASNAMVCVLTFMGMMSIGMIYVTALLGGIVWAVAYPAGRAVFPMYVRRTLVPAGNAVLALISGVATVMLPLLAGSVVLGSQGTQGLSVAFGIDALCVALSIPMLVAVGRRGAIRLPAPQQAPSLDTGGTRIPRRFYAYVLVSSVLVFGPVQVLLPIMLVQRNDPRYLSVYVAQFAGIGLASMLSTATHADMRGVIRRIIGCWTVAVSGYVLLFAGMGLATVLPAFFLLAAASNVYGIQSQSWLQMTAASQHIGQEMTWLSAVTLGAVPIAALCTGALVDTLQPAMAAGAIALAILVAIVLSGLRRSVQVRPLA